MPTDQIDTVQPSIVAAPPPVRHTPEENDYLAYLRNAMVFDETEPQAEGWQMYATPKFLGRASLAAYGFTLLSVGLAPWLFRGEWLPVVSTPEMAIFGLPIAVAGGWLAWTSPDEKTLEKQRSWTGRLAAFLVAYLLLQTVATLFNFAWVNVFTIRP